MAAILVVAVAWAVARQAPFPTFMTDAICKVSAAVGHRTPARTDRAAVTRAARTTPDDVDIPEGLDPESDLVQMLLSTERGRQTLQWLADNDIPIVIDPRRHRRVLERHRRSSWARTSTTPPSWCTRRTTRSTTPRAAVPTPPS